MILCCQVQFWLIFFIVLCGFLYVFFGILLFFVVGVVVVYLFDFVCDWFECFGMGCMWVMLIIFLVFLIVFVLVFILVLFIFGNQFVLFLEWFFSFVCWFQDLVNVNFGNGLVEVVGINLVDFQVSMFDIVGQGVLFIGKLVQFVWSGGQVLLFIFLLFVIILVVVFYLFLDWDCMVVRIDSWLLCDYLMEIWGLVWEMDGVVVGFVCGQLLVCLLFGIFYVVLFVLVGLNFGFLIGMGVGLISFIFFVGVGLGLVVLIGVVLVQFWLDWLMILIIGVIFVVGQFLEGNVLQLKLVGDSMGLYLVILMFVLFVFGYFFGFVGMLIVVLVVVMIVVFV